MRSALNPLGNEPRTGKISSRSLPKIFWVESGKSSRLEYILSFDPDRMPSRADGAAGSRKRKTPKEAGAPSSKRRAVADNQTADDAMAEILGLEEQISESRKYYNNIAKLISMLNSDEPGHTPNLLVAVSLCRVFSRLIAGGHLSDSKRAAENEKLIVAWLKERCQEYQKALLAVLRNADTSSQVRIPISSVAFNTNRLH